MGVLIAGLLILVSCAFEELGGGTPTTYNTTPIADVLNAIEENGWIVEGTNDPPEDAQTFIIQGVVTYFYKYYAYIVDENNDGIKLYLKDGGFRDVFEGGKLVVATGVAYARDFGDAKEYRLYVESLDDVEVLSDVTLSEPLEIEYGKSLILDEYGKYVVLDATYEGKER